MSYRDFTLEQVRKQFGLNIVQGNLFAEISPIPIPTWLQEALDEGMKLPLISEKSRSEFIVPPVLLASRKLCRHAFGIHSGTRFDVDPKAGLVGEPDFLLTAGPQLPIVTPPVATLVEAKKNDLELGFGQCAAQMVAAWRFNQSEEELIPNVYGCVTTATEWQFLRLTENVLTIDAKRYYFTEIGSVLAVIHAIIEAVSEPAKPQAAI